MDKRLISQDIKRKLNPIYICKRLGAKFLWNAQILLTLFGLYENCDGEKLKKLKDIHKGRIGFLIGSGPSVRVEDLEKLKNEVTFCFNRFHLAYEMSSLRPLYTVSADMGMINNFGNEIVKKSCGTVFIAAKERPVLAGDFTWLGAKYKAPPLVFSKKIYHHVTIGGASLLVALQIGYFMGIEHFVLYGIDHYFKYKIEEYNDQSNAYCTASGDDNHFIKNYRGGKSWCLPDTKMIEKSLRWADCFLREKGGWMINATRGGKLEILERKSLAKMMQKLNNSQQ